MYAVGHFSFSLGILSVSFRWALYWGCRARTVSTTSWDSLWPGKSSSRTMTFGMDGCVSCKGHTHRISVTKTVDTFTVHNICLWSTTDLVHSDLDHLDPRPFISVCHTTVSIHLVSSLHTSSNPFPRTLSSGICLNDTCWVFILSLNWFVEWHVFPLVLSFFYSAENKKHFEGKRKRGEKIERWLGVRSLVWLKWYTYWRCLRNHLKCQFL